MEITKTVQVRLENGRSVVLREGPREDPEAVKRALGEKAYDTLVKQGVIAE